ncbi:sensor domain-containing diguanylate cyclase [Lichenibacterium ramalinae]|uniref:Sensor domain-containing diguanylate cyclase n=1 Tax=Lichenibacterium ramalinae TaxID=2316527 RepID=A0A4Q2RE59_9HYPH|nr:sensor domain-containing diguanylate cyclase [Lichenibacterium ramalinae]RYB06123.1 sensor domain-containing diguanylate cyclase [Lichenibacterium ramalinae]
MIDVNLIGAPAFAVKVVGDGFAYAGVNRRMTDLVGLRPEDVVGQSPQRCWPPEMARAIVARYRHCVTTRQALASEAHYDLPGGGRWWHVTMTPVFAPDGQVSALVGLAADVSDRKAAERERRESDARMALAMDVLDGGFWHLDLASRLVEISPKLSGLMAGRPEPRMGWDDFTAAIHPEDRDALDVSALARGECEDATMEFRAGAGPADGMRWFRSRCRVMRCPAGRPRQIVGVVRDITDQRRLQDLYERQARTDALTGLANRRGFEGSAGRFLRGDRAAQARFGLVLLDLDRFKPINDRYGHAVGDAVLREIARRLGALVRPEDVVARIGGDEFAILVADVAGDALPALAERLVRAADAPVSTPVGDLSVGFSIGVATSTMADAAIGDLSDRADRALYEVKLSGRGTWRLAA